MEITITHQFADANAYNWSLIAVGDIYSGQILQSGQIQAEIVAQLETADLTIGNFEGATSATKQPAVKSGPCLLQAAALPRQLCDAGFDLMTLANNHTLDYGQEGLAHTISACTGAGLEVYGAGTPEQAYRPYQMTKVNGQSVAIFSFGEREFGVAQSPMMGAETPGTAWISDPYVGQMIRNAAEDHTLVIVLAHGGVENTPFPPWQRQQHLRYLIECGADIVIGHHPHVAQGWEAYQHGWIFYSLGNFLFDYAVPGLTQQPYWGAILQLGFKEARLAGVHLIPVGFNPQDKTLRLLHTSEGLINYWRMLSDMLIDDYATLWQVAALDLWQKRAWPALAKQLGLLPRLAEQSKALTAKIKSRLTKTSTNVPTLSQDAGLYLLNSIRNESHRWVSETALESLHSDLTQNPQAEAHYHQIMTLNHELQRTLQQL